jgi:hypothetical protein
MYSKGKSINELADDKEAEWEKLDYDRIHYDSKKLEKQDRRLLKEADFWSRVRAKAKVNGDAEKESDAVVIEYLRSTTPGPGEESAKKRLIDKEVASAQGNNSNHPRSNDRVGDTGDNTGGDTGGD